MTGSQVSDVFYALCLAALVGFLVGAAVFWRPRRREPTADAALINAFALVEALNVAVRGLPGRWWLSASTREVRLCDDLHHRRPRKDSNVEPAAGGRDPGPPPNQGTGGKRR